MLVRMSVIGTMHDQVLQLYCVTLCGVESSLQHTQFNTSKIQANTKYSLFLVVVLFCFVLGFVCLFVCFWFGFVWGFFSSLERILTFVLVIPEFEVN